MKPSPIVIPAQYSPFRQKMGERKWAGSRRQQTPAAPAVARRRFISSGGRELARPAVQGWACLHDKAFYANDRFRVLRLGAFSETLKDGKRKPLIFDHDGRREYGDTDTGLEFASCLQGLAFRMPIRDDEAGRAIFDNVMSNKRPCVSIGADVIEKKIRWAKDIEFDDCARVDLREISLVPEGAVSNTFAAIVDLDDENPYLWAACRTSDFAAQATVANVSARATRLVERLEQLKAEICSA
ncbi:MAG: hypothetical protein ABS54_06315 [Hyphomicrobium sp. SCN 65-11]|nr:MAG: hypothetical protein ABS54_06315 [Hyphomicrobium sp. SCN 65-11]